MRKKTIVMLAMTLLSAILFVPLIKAQITSREFNVYAWVDKLQYAPGDSGTLYITIRNDLATEVYVYNITVEYPWHAYAKDHWEGNETIEVKAAIARDGGVINKESKFTVPKDGKAITVGTTTINVDVWTDELGKEDPDNAALISVATPPLHMALKGMDTWMTYLTVALVVCTIILAIVIFLATRRPRAPRALIPRAPAPPPPKSKATA
jgi:hypothetical protein